MIPGDFRPRRALLRRSDRSGRQYPTTEGLLVAPLRPHYRSIPAAAVQPRGV